MTAGRQRACPLNEDAVALVLYALEPDQEVAVWAHLPGCASCQEIVRTTELVAEGLAVSVEQVEPPARMRAIVLAGARPVAVPRAVPPLPSGPLRPGPSPRRPRRRRRMVAVAVAAVLAAGGFTGYATYLHHQRDAETSRAQALADLITQMDAPGSTHTTLRSDSGEPVAAVLTGVPGETVVVSGLPANDPTRSVYVVWGIGTAAPRPIGTLDVTGPGPTAFALAPAQPEQPFLGYAISFEPGRSAPATPTVVVATGQVAV